MKRKPAGKGKPQRLRAPKGGITFQGKFYRGGQFLPAAAAVHLEGHKRSQRPARQQPSHAGVDDEALVLIALSELPVSTEAALSLHRMMSGRATQRDQTILRVRELQAIEALRERSTTDREWVRWNDRYIRMANGVTA